MLSVLSLLVVSLVFYGARSVNVQTSESLHRGAEYKVIGYDFSNELKYKVSQTSTEDQEECDFREEGSTQVFKQCPDDCRTDITQFNEDFQECAPLAQFGCSQTPCTSGSTPGFNCALNRTAVENDNIVCQGSKIIFDQIDIKRFGEITFNIDISAPPVQTDLYFLADTTGTMNEAIGTASRKAGDMVNVFGDRENVAFGVGHYEDERDLDGGFEHQFNIAEDTKNAIRAIRRWRTGDGQDVEEANLVALYRIATEDRIGWRQGSRKFVVYFGDAPGHEPTCDESGKSITRDLVIDALNAKNITVVAVNFGNLDDAVRSWPIAGCSGETGAPEGQATDITTATGGAVISSNDQSQLVSLIETALKLVKRTYDVENTCAEYLTSNHNPALPIVLEPLETAQVKNTIKIKDFFCDTEDFTFDCELTYLERGANIEGGVQYSYIDILGC